MSFSKHFLFFAIAVIAFCFVSIAIAEDCDYVSEGYCERLLNGCNGESVNDCVTYDINDGQGCHMITDLYLSFRCVKEYPANENQEPGECGINDEWEVCNFYIAYQPNPLGPPGQANCTCTGTPTGSGGQYKAKVCVEASDDCPAIDV